MVIINSKKITIYDNDTMIDIIQRIANTLKSLPDLLITDDLPDKNEMVANPQLDINIENMIDILEKHTNDLVFSPFLNDTKKFKMSNLDKFSLWIHSNKFNKDPNFVENLKTEIVYLLPDENINIENTLKGTNPMKKILEKIEKQNKNVTLQEIINKQFSILPSYPISNFFIEKIIYDISLNLIQTPIELFDNMKISSFNPYMSISNFYKIEEGFLPPLEWSQTLEHILLMKILVNPTKKNITDRFIDVFFLNNPDEENITIQLRIDKKLDENYRNQLIRKILDCIDLKTDIKINTIKENGVSGLLFMPSFYFDEVVYSDLIMNDAIVSKYLAVDESKKANKKILNTHFFDPSRPNLGTIFSNLISKIADKKDLEIRNLSRTDFPLGKPLTRIKILRAKNLESITNFTQKISKIASIYNFQKEEIVKFYTKYLPDFSPKILTEKEIKLELKQSQPDIFVKDFPRLCGKQPKILDPNEIKEWESSGRDYIIFPKSPEEGNQFYYGCDHTNHKFTGVIKNKLSNKEQYPYLPCCYLVDQKDKKNSGYKEYYEGKIKKSTQPINSYP